MQASLGRVSALIAEELSEIRATLANSGETGRKIAQAIESIHIEQLHGNEYSYAAQRISHAALAGVGSPQATVNHRVLAIASLLVTLPERLREFPLPESFLPYYAREIAKIRSHISGAGDVYRTDADDSYIKDCRFALGLSIPCGAQSVEIDDVLRVRSLVKHLLVLRDPRPLLQLGRKAVRNHWFGIHTDSRDVSEFNDDGWRACYLRIGELLERFPSISGVVGTSWFFDPQVLTVSPRLGYLQRRPIDGGAVAIRNGPGSIHTERATATSDTRRKLFQEGKYTPVCYTIAWPRAELLRWCSAERDRS